MKAKFSDSAIVSNTPEAADFIGNRRESSNDAAIEKEAR